MESRDRRSGSGSCRRSPCICSAKGTVTGVDINATVWTGRAAGVRLGIDLAALSHDLGGRLRGETRALTGNAAAVSSHPPGRRGALFSTLTRHREAVVPVPRHRGAMVERRGHREISYPRLVAYISRPRFYGATKRKLGVIGA